VGPVFFLQVRAKKIFRSRAKRRVLTGCDAAINPALQGRDEERAFPVRTRNWDFKKGRKRLCGGSKGQFFSQTINDPACIEFSYVYLGSGPAILDGLDFGPLGRKTNTGVLLNNSSAISWYYLLSIIA
jgi:hypothetical protein